MVGEGKVCVTVFLQRQFLPRGFSHPNVYFKTYTSFVLKHFPLRDPLSTLQIVISIREIFKKTRLTYLKNYHAGVYDFQGIVGLLVSYLKACYLTISNPLHSQNFEKTKIH